MQSDKVKLLSNYQLFQLLQNNSLDQETLTRIHYEFRARNISTLELKELQKRHEATFKESMQELDSNIWDPLYTAFAWKRHFKHIALLRTQGNKSVAKQYQIRFYVGVLIYMLLAILLILLVRK